MTFDIDSGTVVGFIFYQQQVLFVQTAGGLTLPTEDYLVLQHLNCMRKHTLGELHGLHFFCAELADDAELPSNCVLMVLKQAFELMGDKWYAMGAKAFSILNWDSNHQFCGRCGHQTEQLVGRFERQCMHCHLAAYPRISPSMIVRISHGDELLMARSPHYPPGAYGLIAGFIEAGENVETAVHREVREEVGINIKDLRYFGSQAWPFPDSLMIAFTANYASGELIVDKNELESAAWYRYDALPGQPSSSFTIGRKLIADFVATQTAAKAS